MPLIELALTMLLAVIVSGFLVRILPVAVPLPLVQILLGVLISAVFHRGVGLDPDIFFLLFLPPLLFLDGWRIPREDLLRNRKIVLQLALGLVVFTVVGAGYLIHALVPVLPLAAAFALAAIVSPTDPVAVSSIAARAPIPKRLMHILEGESLLNDASGLVCFQFAVAAVMTGGFSLAGATLTFFWVALAGLACGVGFTLAVTRFQHWLSRKVGEEEGSPILISILIPFGAYLLAELLHASGILAAVTAGITMGHVEYRGISLATTRIQKAAVWNTIQFALNGIMFVLLGEQLPRILYNAMDTMHTSGIRHVAWLAVYAFAITAGLILLRFLWVWVSLKLNFYRNSRTALHNRKVSRRLLLAMSLAGVRGSITLAGVLTLPLFLPDGSVFPARDIVIFLAAAVILLSLLLASLALPVLLKDLQLPVEPGAEREEDRARNAMNLAAIDAIKQTQGEMLERAGSEEVDIYTDAASRAVDYYSRWIRDEQDEGRARVLRKADAAEKRLHLAAIQGKRVCLAKLKRQHQIEEELAGKLGRELDLMEMRYR